jgi:hypothetical protein
LTDLLLTDQYTDYVAISDLFSAEQIIKSDALNFGFDPAKLNTACIRPGEPALPSPPFIS